MSSSAQFDIYSTIDQLVDKFSNDLRVRLRKAAERQEKVIVKQMGAVQSKQTKQSSSRQPNTKQAPPRRRQHHDSEDDTDDSR